MIDEKIQRCKQILDLQNDRLYMLLDAIEENASDDDFDSVRRLIQSMEKKLDETKKTIGEISEKFYQERKQLINDRFQKVHYCSSEDD